MTALLWLRRDLRLHDHPALQAASEHEQLIPVFCWDRRLLNGRHRSALRTDFMHRSLLELADAFRAIGSDLLVLNERPETALPALAAACGASVVYATADVSVFARRRDRAVGAALQQLGVGLELFPGQFVLDDLAALRTGNGDPYSVFTPFYRRWLSCPRRRVIEAPQRLPPMPPLAPAFVPAAPPPILTDADAYPGQQRDRCAAPGEAAARKRLEQLVQVVAGDYPESHDLPARDGTSELSPYLHFGSISAREVEARLDESDGAEAVRRQLCWRDFYGQVLLNNPGNTVHEQQPRYRRKIRWSGSRQDFDAWCEGRTGYPLVDAGMRQLAETGWMHNRVRMVVGSFLVKDLGIDWRWGERWFMRALIDGDQANNNGNWQWIASVGVDPAPVARRLFNPVLQQQRFDPNGDYVHSYVPELHRVPIEYLAEPWTMSAELQRDADCVIGSDYPAPIVEHAAARRAALDRYAQAAQR
jgi:deoxyribodipyrimidine photo-lyase